MIKSLKKHTVSFYKIEGENVFNDDVIYLRLSDARRVTNNHNYKYSQGKWRIVEYVLDMTTAQQVFHSVFKEKT